MTLDQRDPVVYIVSDSVGETAELVVRAAASQFRDRSIDIRRIPYVEDQKTVGDRSLSEREWCIYCFYTCRSGNQKIFVGIGG